MAAVTEPHDDGAPPDRPEGSEMTPHEFLVEYDRLMGLPGGGDDPDSEQDWFRLKEEAVHLLADVLNGVPRGEGSPDA